jgi:hypothetical protein
LWDVTDSIVVVRHGRIVSAAGNTVLIRDGNGQLGRAGRGRRDG